MPQSKITLANVERVFTYQTPRPEQTASYEALRTQFISMAHGILLNCPEGPDRDHALQQLRDCRMWANASIALREV